MELTKSVMEEILEEINKDGVVFSKEIQFQFAFAEKLKEKYKESKVEIILENLSYITNGKNKEKIYSDIVVKLNDYYYPIELKFKTADKTVVYHNGEKAFYTFNQGAVESGCYDFIKDIKRIETLFETDSKNIKYTSLGNSPQFKRGFVILLTNYDKYYSLGKEETYWKNYSLYEDRIIKREEKLEWYDTKEWQSKSKYEDFDKWLTANLGSKRANEEIQLSNEYRIEWSNKAFYPDGITEEKGKGETEHKFKYLIVSVENNSKDHIQ